MSTYRFTCKVRADIRDVLRVLDDKLGHYEQKTVGYYGPSDAAAVCDLLRRLYENPDGVVPTNLASAISLFLKREDAVDRVLGETPP